MHSHVWILFDLTKENLVDQNDLGLVRGSVADFIYSLKPKGYGTVFE